jgi:hypothetical protein
LGNAGLEGCITEVPDESWAAVAIPAQSWKTVLFKGLAMLITLLDNLNDLLGLCCLQMI